MGRGWRWLWGRRFLRGLGLGWRGRAGCGSGSDVGSCFGSGSGGSWGRGSGSGSGSGYSSSSSARSGSRPRYRGKRTTGAGAAKGKDEDGGWESWQRLVGDGYETVDGQLLDPWLMKTMVDKKTRSGGVFVHMVEEKSGRGEWALYEGRSAVFLMPGCYDPALVGEDNRKQAPRALTAAAMAGVETVDRIAERWLKYGWGRCRTLLLL